MTNTTTVSTATGDARLLNDEADKPWLRLVLGHGAGGGPGARDLIALAEALPASGISVVRMEQPWSVRGGRVAPRPEALDAAWLEAVGQVPRDVPLVVGGRSAGARVACRTAAQVEAVGVLALAFPLHPPWKPERSRFGELAASGVPTLVVQGERDGFGQPDEFPHGEHELAVVPYANHGMAVPKAHDQDAALGVVVTAATTWLERFAPAR